MGRPAKYITRAHHKHREDPRAVTAWSDDEYRVVHLTERSATPKELTQTEEKNNLPIQQLNML